MEYLKTVVKSKLEANGLSWAVAERVLNCESGWNEKAVGDNLNGTKDVGLWQINDIHGLTDEERKDPHVSTSYAIKLIKSDIGFKHWACYTKLYGNI